VRGRCQLSGCKELRTDNLSVTAVEMHLKLTAELASDDHPVGMPGNPGSQPAADPLDGDHPIADIKARRFNEARVHGHTFILHRRGCIKPTPHRTSACDTRSTVTKHLPDQQATRIGGIGSAHVSDEERADGRDLRAESAERLSWAFPYAPLCRVRHNGVYGTPDQAFAPRPVLFP